MCCVFKLLPGMHWLHSRQTTVDPSLSSPRIQKNKRLLTWAVAFMFTLSFVVDASLLCCNSVGAIHNLCAGELQPTQFRYKATNETWQLPVVNLCESWSVWIQSSHVSSGLSGL